MANRVKGTVVILDVALVTPRLGSIAEASKQGSDGRHAYKDDAETALQDRT